MFSKTILAAVLSVVLAANSAHGAPASNATDKVAPVPASAQYTGDATFYYPNGGYGACGTPLQNTDLIVALNPTQYQSGANCGRRIAATYNGHRVEVTVRDLCPGCGAGGIDLSSSAFQVLAPLSVGRLHGVTWNFL